MPITTNNVAAEYRMYSGFKNLDNAAPKEIVTKVTVENARHEPKNTDSIDPDLADKERLASCVLSPSSASNMPLKAVIKIFQSINHLLLGLIELFIPIFPNKPALHQLNHT